MSNGKYDHIDLLIKSILHGDSVELKDMRANELDSSSSHYQIYTFLELEKKRLQLMQSIFSDKLQKILTYPQIDFLIEEQIGQQEDLIILLTEKIRPLDSNFNNKMRNIWDRVFSRHSK